MKKIFKLSAGLTVATVLAGYASLGVAGPTQTMVQMATDIPGGPIQLSTGSNVAVQDYGNNYYGLNLAPGHSSGGVNVYQFTYLPTNGQGQCTLTGALLSVKADNQGNVVFNQNSYGPFGVLIRCWSGDCSCMPDKLNVNVSGSAKNGYTLTITK